MVGARETPIFWRLNYTDVYVIYGGIRLFLGAAPPRSRSCDPPNLAATLVVLVDVFSEEKNPLVFIVASRASVDSVLEKRKIIGWCVCVCDQRISIVLCVCTCTYIQGKRIVHVFRVLASTCNAAVDANAPYLYSG